MRRRDFTAGLLLGTAVGTVRARVPTKQHRIAIITTQPVATIDDPTIPVFGHFSRNCAGWATSRDQTSLSSGIREAGAPRSIPIWLASSSPAART